MNFTISELTLIIECVEHEYDICAHSGEASDLVDFDRALKKLTDLKEYMIVLERKRREMQNGA